MKTDKEILANINGDRSSVIESIVLWGSLISLIGGWIIIQTYITGVY